MSVSPNDIDLVNPRTSSSSSQPSRLNACQDFFLGKRLRSSSSSSETGKNKEARTSTSSSVASVASSSTTSSSSRYQESSGSAGSIDSCALPPLPSIGDLVSPGLFGSPPVVYPINNNITLPSFVDGFMSECASSLRALISKEQHLHGVCNDLLLHLERGTVPKALAVSTKLELPSSSDRSAWLSLFHVRRKAFEQDALRIVIEVRFAELSVTQAALVSFFDEQLTKLMSDLQLPSSSSLAAAIRHRLEVVAFETYVAGRYMNAQRERKKLASSASPPASSSSSSSSPSSASESIAAIVKATATKELRKQLAALQLVSSSSSTSSTKAKKPSQSSSRPSSPSSKKETKKKVTTKKSTNNNNNNKNKTSTKKQPNASDHQQRPKNGRRGHAATQPAVRRP